MKTTTIAMVEVEEANTDIDNDADYYVDAITTASFINGIRSYCTSDRRMSVRRSAFIKSRPSFALPVTVLS